MEGVVHVHVCRTLRRLCVEICVFCTPGKKQSLVKHGRIDIVQCLKSLPRSKNHLSSFNVDVMRATVSQFVSLLYLTLLSSPSPPSLLSFLLSLYDLFSLSLTIPHTAPLVSFSLHHFQSLSFPTVQNISMSLII